MLTLDALKLPFAPTVIVPPLLTVPLKVAVPLAVKVEPPAVLRLAALKVRPPEILADELESLSETAPTPVKLACETVNELLKSVRAFPFRAPCPSSDEPLAVMPPEMLDPLCSVRLLVPPVKKMLVEPEIEPELVIAIFCPTIPVPVPPGVPMLAKPPASPPNPPDPAEIVP